MLLKALSTAFGPMKIGPAPYATTQEDPPPMLQHREKGVLSQGEGARTGKTILNYFYGDRPLPIAKDRSARGPLGAEKKCDIHTYIHRYIDTRRLWYIYFI